MPVSPVMPYACQLCPFVGDTWKAIRWHIVGEHPKEVLKADHWQGLWLKTDLHHKEMMTRMIETEEQKKNGVGVAASERHYLSAKDILDADDVQMDEMQAWGGWICLRAPSAESFDRYQAGVATYDGEQVTMRDNARSRLVALCIVDGQGRRLFTDAQVMQLGRKSSKELGRVYNRCRELCGMTKEKQAATEGNSEEASGNSES